MTAFRLRFPSRTVAAILLSCLASLVAVTATRAGIQGSGVRKVMAYGTISPGRALSVNGVTYDASGAQVVINGEAADRSRLHVGHIVSIVGTVSSDDDNAIAVADQITLVSEVRGEITAVNAKKGTLEVLGQTVSVPAGVSGVERGMLVNVSGFPDADGVFHASSLEVESAQPFSQVKGVVRALDRDHAVLQVGDLAIDYSSAAVQGTIAEGVTVIAKGTSVGGSLPQFGLVASSVAVYTGLGEPGEKGDLEGIITSFASAEDFDVNGQPVRADADTKYLLHGTQLGANVQVRVKGRFDTAGVLVANKVQADKPPKKK